MGWKTTTNKLKQPSNQTVLTKEDVERYFVQLLPELNLRLLLECNNTKREYEKADILLAKNTQILWVESITLTVFEESQKQISKDETIWNKLKKWWSRDLHL
ncbi:MAG: hypothetical protein IJF07_04005 [Lachnospiraceae bacterium]|nr:hypothetical protein [Lachnospiraceae bacterium]